MTCNRSAGLGRATAEVANRQARGSSRVPNDARKNGHDDPSRSTVGKGLVDQSDTRSLTRHCTPYFGRRCACRAFPSHRRRCGLGLMCSAEGGQRDWGQRSISCRAGLGTVERSFCLRKPQLGGGSRPCGGGPVNGMFGVFLLVTTGRGITSPAQRTPGRARCKVS